MSLIKSAFMKTHERAHDLSWSQNILSLWKYPGHSASDLEAIARTGIKVRAYSMEYYTENSVWHSTKLFIIENDKSTRHMVFGIFSRCGSSEGLYKIYTSHSFRHAEHRSEKTFSYLMHDAVEENLFEQCLESIGCKYQENLAVPLKDLSSFDRDRIRVSNNIHKFEVMVNCYIYSLFWGRSTIYLQSLGQKKISPSVVKGFLKSFEKETPMVVNFLSRCKFLKDSEIAKAVTEEIQSAFVRVFRTKINILFVYCAKSAKNEMQNFLWPDILVVVTRGVKKAPFKRFCGFDVVFRDNDFYLFSDESKKVLHHETLLNSIDSSKLMNLPLDNVCTQDLMRKHKNITLVSFSRVRSQNFEKCHEMHRKDCIVIYCWVKGFIPVGEKAFPKKIKNIDVDVREGACFFAADENFLQIGSKIGRRYGSSLGTLGGFVNIDSSTIGCLTCAHVVCPPAALQSEDIVRFISSNLIEVENKSDSDVIGTVERAVFKHSNSREVSVDAALVKISRQHPENGSFLLEISDAQLLSAGFSAYNRPAFTNGAIIKIDSTNYRRPLLKCGASSGLTVGYAHCINVHAAIINDKEIEFEFGNFKVHGQIEVLPVQRPDKENEAANNKFAINGDSGSLVFMIEEDMPPVLKCVGMVTAVTTYGSCLVTPIDHVLLDLGLPLNAFCKFGNEDQSRSDVEINDTIVERIVRDVTQAISTNFDSTFQTINRRLDALEERNSM